MAIRNLKELKHWYEHNEAKVSIASLAGGFIIDSLTLQSIDNLWDNLWIAFNLLVSALCIIWLNRQKNPEEGFWLPNILQFSFGALLGSTFVFYLRSTTLSATWPFLALLLVALLVNEFFQKRWARLAFQISFLYFGIYSFSIFLLPVLLNKVGPGIFLLSGVASLLIIRMFIRILGRYASETFLEQRLFFRGQLAH